MITPSGVIILIGTIIIKLVTTSFIWEDGIQLDFRKDFQNGFLISSNLYLVGVAWRTSYVGMPVMALSFKLSLKSAAYTSLLIRIKKQVVYGGSFVSLRLLSLAGVNGKRLTNPSRLFRALASSGTCGVCRVMRTCYTCLETFR